MHIISRATLRIFWETHPEAQAGLRYWYKQVSQAKWQSFQDIRQDFSSADLVGNFIVLFISFSFSHKSPHFISKCFSCFFHIFL